MIDKNNYTKEEMFEYGNEIRKDMDNHTVYMSEEAKGNFKLMNNEFTHLKNSLTDLKDTITSGFKGVHKRQDDTNGNVKKNSDFRIKNEETISEFIDISKFVNRLKANLTLIKAVIGIVGISGVGSIANIFINLVK